MLGWDFWLLEFGFVRLLLRLHMRPLCWADILQGLSGHHGILHTSPPARFHIHGKNLQPCLRSGQTLWGCHERPDQDPSVLPLLSTIVAFILCWRELLLLVVIPGDALLFLLLRLIIVRPRTPSSLVTGLITLWKHTSGRRPSVVSSVS